MTIGLTWRRTARRIKRLKEAVLSITPDYSIARPPTFWRSRLIEEKIRNGILCTPSVNPPRKTTHVVQATIGDLPYNFLRASTREKRYPTCFKFRFVSSPQKR